MTPTRIRSGAWILLFSLLGVSAVVVYILARGRGGRWLGFQVTAHVPISLASSLLDAELKGVNEIKIYSSLLPL